VAGAPDTTTADDGRGIAADVPPAEFAFVETAADNGCKTPGLAARSALAVVATAAAGADETGVGAELVGVTVRTFVQLLTRS
jgi:hypothetical protein